MEKQENLYNWQFIKKYEFKTLMKVYAFNGESNQTEIPLN